MISRKVVNVHNCFLQVELLNNGSISLFSCVDGTVQLSDFQDSDTSSTLAFQSIVVAGIKSPSKFAKATIVWAISTIHI